MIDVGGEYLSADGCSWAEVRYDDGDVYKDYFDGCRGALVFAGSPMVKT